MRRTLTAALLAAALLLASAVPAAATHTHARELPNGACVLLAANGGEKDVQLPNADDYPDNRRHPLHTNVHLGQPGERGTIFVALTDAGDVTEEARQRCSRFVNGDQLP